MRRVRASPLGNVNGAPLGLLTDHLGRDHDGIEWGDEVIDLGRARGEGCRVRGAAGGPAAIAGLAIDADRRLWIADPIAAAVRTFTVCGREMCALRSAEPR